MHPLLLRTKAHIRDAVKPVAEGAIGALTVAMLRTTRYFDPDKTANLFGRIARLIGPAMREQKMGRADPARRGAPKRPARRDAGRPVPYQWGRGYFLRPQDESQSNAGQAPAPGRVSDPWRAGHPPARSSISRRAV